MIYYIAISKDEDREFIYQDIRTLGENKKIEKALKIYNKHKVMVVPMPTESVILICSKSRETLRIYKEGMSFAYNKYEIWDNMYDNCIDNHLGV